MMIAMGEVNLEIHLASDAAKVWNAAVQARMALHVTRNVTVAMLPTGRKASVIIHLVSTTSLMVDTCVTGKMILIVVVLTILC